MHDPAARDVIQPLEHLGAERQQRRRADPADAGVGHVVLQCAALAVHQQHQQRQICWDRDHPDQRQHVAVVEQRQDRRLFEQLGPSRASVIRRLGGLGGYQKRRGTALGLAELVLVDLGGVPFAEQLDSQHVIPADLAWDLPGHGQAGGRHGVGADTELPLGRRRRQCGNHRLVAEPRQPGHHHKDLGRTVGRGAGC